MNSMFVCVCVCDVLNITAVSGSERSAVVRVVEANGSLFTALLAVARQTSDWFI